MEHKASSDDTVRVLPIHLAVSQLITCLCCFYTTQKLLWGLSFVSRLVIHCYNDLMPYKLSDIAASSVCF